MISLYNILKENDYGKIPPWTKVLYSFPYPVKVFRGIQSNNLSRKRIKKMEYFTNNKKVALTYGDKIIEKEIQPERAFVWTMDPTSYESYNNTYGLIDTLENAMHHILTHSEGYEFRRFGETHIIPKETDCICVENIIDTFVGDLELDWDLEGTPEWNKQVRKYISTIYILPS